MIRKSCDLAPDFATNFAAVFNPEVCEYHQPNRANIHMMQRFPAVSIRALKDCEPGELVQYRWAGNALGIVMGEPSPDQRLSVLLTGSVEPTPCFFPLGQNDQTVLSYGKDYMFELDPNGPKDFSGSTLWDKNGAIFVTENNWSIQVLPARSSGFYSSAHFDLEKFTVVDAPSQRFTIFGNWELNLYHPISRQKISIYKFSQ